MQRTRFSWLSWLALAVSVVAVGLLMAAGPGYQAGWFALGTALQRMLTWAAYLGTGALALGVASLLANAWKGGAAAVSRSVIAIVLGALSVGVPLRWQREVQSVPRIHDISTDTVTPPRYVEIARIRQDLQVPNSLDYLEEVAEQQRTGYPDLGPVFLAMPPAEAHARALAAAERLGWEIVASDVASGRIEATDTTFWFRFKDDVAIRVSAVPDGTSRVDVRSVSRVGRSDIGTNARRIRSFLAELGG
jgi:uncharacterized protein (DUF1499 family)